MDESVFDRVSRFYDFEQEEFTKDIPFYLEYAKQCGGEVLELACGTGRIVVPLAQHSIRITGLDISERMLGIARKKVNADESIKENVRLINGDMRTFDLKKKFSMVLIAFRSFQSLLTKEDHVACLKTVHKHLFDDGVFILDLFAPRHDLLAQVHRTFGLDRFYDAENGVYVARRAVDKYDLVQQTLHEDRFCEWTDKKGNFHHETWSFGLAYLFRYEVELLLQTCGFQTEQVFGDFDKSSYDYYSGEQIFVATRS